MDQDRLPEAGVTFWVETTLRDALDDPAVIDNTLAVLKVAHENGDPPRELMKKVLAAFVFDALGIFPPRG